MWPIRLLALAVVTHGVCQREFFAQPVIYDKAMSIDFYYTGINMGSVAACAEFCGDRHFCRTAIYNTFAKTCAISYEYTLNCRYNTKRFKEFEVKKSSSHLIQIACIDKCNDPNKILNYDAPVTPRTSIITADPFDSDSSPAVLKKVQLVTGQPHDSTNPSVDYVRLARARAAPSKAGVIETPKDEEGYVNRLIIENFNPTLAHNSDAPRPVVSKFMRTGSQICYRQQKQRFLLGGDFERHENLTDINACRCLCAETYSTRRGHICQSLQWYDDNSCILNKGNHFGKFDLIKDKTSLYEYIDCDAQVLIDVAEQLCGWKTTEPTRRSSPLNRSGKDTYQLPFIPRTTVEESSFVTESSFVRKSTTSDTSGDLETSETVTSPTSPEASVLPEASTSDVINSPSSTTSEHPSAFVTESSVTSSEAAVTSSETHECFERLDNHMMVSVAGGLEHDVTIDECICICANSKASGRYSFHCASVTYYHNERDCVLNLENRKQKPQYFEHQLDDFNVTYIGITCPREEALSKVLIEGASDGCTVTTTTTTTTTTLPSRSTGEHSDDCFLELPSFVMEGTAQQLESNVTPQQCKCLCAQAENRYGEACQSFQYYYDSRTCLLNKYNRFSNPENFNYVESPQQRSYFEFKCATDETKQKRYIGRQCQIDDQVLLNQLLNEGSGSDETIDSTQKPLEDVPFTTTSSDLSEEITEDPMTKVDGSTEISSDAYKRVSSETDVPQTDSSDLQRVTVSDDAGRVSGDVTTPMSDHSEERSESEERTKSEENAEKEEKLEESVEKDKEEEEEEKEKNKQSEEEEEHEETEEEESSGNPDDSSDDVTTTTTTPKPRKRKFMTYIKKANINRAIPETEGLNDKDFEEKIVTELAESLEEEEETEEAPSTTPTLTKATTTPTKKTTKGKPINTTNTRQVSSTTATKRKTPATVTRKAHKQLPMDDVSLPPKNNQLMNLLKRRKLAKKALGVKTKKFTDKLEKKPQAPELEDEEEEPEVTTEAPETSTFLTTSTAAYPAAGRCTYSALYQTAFLGRKLIKSVHVKTAQDCFAACFALRCRSANLISQGDMNQCELFHDSLIDYRRADMIGYDGSTVYFDGIRCDGV